MIRKGLIVIPSEGFANRIRMIASSKILCDNLKIKLLICWRETNDYNIGFNDIFDNKELEHINFNEINKKRYIYFGHVHTNSIIDKIKEIKDSKDIIYDYIVIKGGHSFKDNKMKKIKYLQMKNIFYKKLLFKKNIKKIYNNFIKNVGEEYICIHYRDINKDFDTLDLKNNEAVNFTENSPISKYFEIIDKLKSNIKLVIVSNTLKFYNEYKKKYKKEAYTLSIKECNRSNKNNMILSIVDFNILLNASLIIGNYYSSFSDEASFFNLIPKITPLNKKLINKNILNNYHCINYSSIDNIYGLHLNYNILIKYFLF